MLKDAVRLNSEQLFSVLSTIRRFGLLIDQIEFFSSSGGEKGTTSNAARKWPLSLLSPNPLYRASSVFSDRLA